MSDRLHNKVHCEAPGDVVGASSRRRFLAAAAMAAGSGALRTSSARAQAPAAAFVDLSNEQIAVISMVVRDAEKVARGFAQVFGTSWRFFQFKPTNVAVGGKPQSQAVELKLALGHCGGHLFKLIQPVSGASAFSEFLERNGGEGFYSIGVGAPRGADRIISALTQAGVPVAIQGDVGDGSQFVVFDTAADLGPRLEILTTAKVPTSSLLTEVGRYSATGAPILDLELPTLVGGRRFNQIGLVVKDAQHSASRYEALLGIKGWQFRPIPVSAAALRGKPYNAAELESATVTAGVSYIGDTQIELLAPVAQGPGGIHRKFLDKHGSYNGFQHLMISPSAGDRDEVLSRFDKAGFAREWTATVHIGPMTANGDYVDLEERLGGFVLEFNA